MKRLAAALIFTAGLYAQKPLVTIESTTPVNPPGWAALERRLIETMSDAAFRYYEKYTHSGGFLVWKTSGLASLDDLPESFYNFPLLYALGGGDDRLRRLSFQAWNDTIRQLTYDFPIFDNEFPKYGDWFHIGEGIIYFYFLPLADPTDHETISRAKRYAGFYLNEFPEARNYDPKLRMIRAGESGSLGPLFDYRDKKCPCILPPWYGSKPPEPYVRSLTEPPPYQWTREMAGYGLPLEDVPGIRTSEALKDPENARRMGVEVMKRIYPGDVPINLASTSLAMNAYIFTGDRKYADWIKEYIGAWLERTKANGGITPDNIGPNGKIGENHNGEWWGGLYGWRWPHGYHSVGQALHIAASNAMLASGGDKQYLDIPRLTMDYLIARGKQTDAGFRVPTQKNSREWFAWQPMDRSYMGSLWFMSQEARDWERIRKIRALEKADWRVVADSHNKMDAGHDAPWLAYLAGENPDYPERMLSSACGQVSARMDRIRQNMMLMDTDPARWEKVEPGKVDLTQVSEHHWQGVNPVTTEALVQLMLGAPQVQYNGGMLHATLRYFDPERKRPGIPRDVAALVSRIEPERAVVELVNLSPFNARDVMVQAGTFGEHQFTTVKSGARTTDVNHPYFQVHLAPGHGITLELGLRRYANQPTYQLPWQR